MGVSGVQSVDVRSSNNEVAVVYDDTITDVDKMELALNSGGYSVQDVIYPNRAPVADAGKDSSVEENTLVKLDGSGSNDPDNDILTYEWRQVSGMVVSLSDSDTSKAVFTAPEIDQDEISLIFELKVADPQNLISKEEVVIKVTDVYQPPTHTDITPQEAKQMIDLDESVIILDVGVRDQYCEEHIPNAVNYSIDDGVLGEKYSNLPVDGKIIVVGTTIEQGRNAADFLDSNGYLNVYYMEGGMSAWEWQTEPCEDDTPVYPVARAGDDQTVYEGRTTTLDGSASFDPNGNPITYSWSTTDASGVILSDAASPKPYFVAPPVDADGATLVFTLETANSERLTHTDNVSITIVDNGITEVPVDVTSIYSATGSILGIEVNGGDLIKLAPEDSSVLPENSGKPESMPHSLLSMEIKTANPGADAVATVYLPEPAPENSAWYQYGKDSAWIDLSSRAAFNSTRDKVSITLSDGGDGDDDGLSNGIIKHSSGLAVIDSPTDNPDNKGDSDSGGGGCFIQSSANHSSKMVKAIVDFFQTSFF